MRKKNCLSEVADAGLQGGGGVRDDRPICFVKKLKVARLPPKEN